MREVQVNTLEGCEDVKPNYYIREDGEVINRKIGKILKQVMSSKGYKMCNLPRITRRKNGKVYNKVQTVHRMVALAFVEGYFDGAVANHLDENKTNNVAGNLGWCTNIENLQYGTALERAKETRNRSLRSKHFLSDPARKRECVRLQAKLDIMEEQLLNIGSTNIFSKHFFIGYVRFRLTLVKLVESEMLETYTSHCQKG